MVYEKDFWIGVKMSFKLPDELVFLTNSKETQKTTTEKMHDKVCVISGSTSGVGLEALKAISKAGAKCVIVARNPEKAQKVKKEIDREYNTNTDIVIADFASFSSVLTAAKEISSKYPIIDVLINSAGLYCTKKTLTQDGNELVFQVNHLSTLLFTWNLLDNIKRCQQGRIIQVNSEGHRFGGLNINNLTWKRRIYTGLRSYGASKIAQIITVREMAKELKDTNITINTMHPGTVKTNLGYNNGWLYRSYNKYILTPSMFDPKISGDALYYLAADKSLSNVSGKFFNLTILEPPASYVLNRKYYDKIYPLSKKLCGIDD